MSSSTSLPGARIGKYRILAHIATGGMGTVYKARDEEIGRVVALKILAPELASNEILVQRFKREARAASRLDHKNAVALYECGEADGFHYLAMEYIKGVDLCEYIRRVGKLDPEEARRILIQACKALEHAFEQGITHRDIKPSNFLLANDEGRCRVKLTDLGLSRIDSEEDFRVTRAGTTVGSVDYMAPEQARDSSLADIRSDIYSLGCTFYHMLAGQPPFGEGGLGERVYKHIAADPPDVRQFNENVPAGLWTVLRRMLAKHPDDRFQTPTEVIAALRSLADSDAPSAMDNEGPPDSEGELPTTEPSPAPVAEAPAPRPVSPVSLPIDRRSPPPEEPTQKKKKKRSTTLSEMNTIPDDSPGALGISSDQRKAAAGQFAHATEVIRGGSDLTYAQTLLLSCVKIDPVNLLYRKMLREVTRDINATRRSSWFSSLTSIPARGRVKKARHNGEHRQVLELGEELLCKLPGDVAVQIDMALSAEELGLPALAIWLLEEARNNDPKSVPALRELAGVYERQKRLPQAIAVWERIRELTPGESEAPDKIRELSVNETLSRGNFRR